MLRRMKQRREVFSEDNKLLLTKPLFFQNTTLVDDARLEPSAHGQGEQRFYGYVYRLDSHVSPPEAFSNGFFPNHLKSGGELSSWPRHREPVQLRGGIITYVCFYAALCSAPHENEAYLIDARDLGGIVRPSPPGFRYNARLNQMAESPWDLPYKDTLLDLFPITKKIFDVVIMYPIENTKVVGVIKAPFMTNRSLSATRLELYVNPEYAGGLEGAKAVAESFNGGREWVVVSASGAA